MEGNKGRSSNIVKGEQAGSAKCNARFSLHRAAVAVAAHRDTRLLSI